MVGGWVGGWVRRCLYGFLYYIRFIFIMLLISALFLLVPSINFGMVCETAADPVFSGGHSKKLHHPRRRPYVPDGVGTTIKLGCVSCRATLGGTHDNERCYHAFMAGTRGRFLSQPPDAKPHRYYLLRYIFGVYFLLRHRCRRVEQYARIYREKDTDGLLLA